MKVIFLFLSILFFSAGIHAQKPDNQWWNDVQITVPVKTTKDLKNKTIDNIVLNLDGIVRLGRNDSFPVDDRLSATLDFRLNKFLKLSPGYLYQRFEQVKNQRSYESRLTFAANLEKKLNLFTFRHRSMFEYKLRNFRPNTETYRARFQAYYSLKHKDKEIFAPFVSEETYYDFTQHLRNRNEFYAGIQRKLTSRVSVDVFYIRLDAMPVNANALGTTLRIRLY